MRPADVCGWKRNPFSSRSLIVLRIVAGDTPRPKRRDERARAGRFGGLHVRLDHGLENRRSRSLSCMRHKCKPSNDFERGSSLRRGRRGAASPGGQPEAAVHDASPSGLAPAQRVRRQLIWLKTRPSVVRNPRYARSGLHIRGREQLLAFRRIDASLEATEPLRVWPTFQRRRAPSNRCAEGPMAAYGTCLQ